VNGGDTLRQLGYQHLGKAERGLVGDFLIKVSGFSRAQVARLIHQLRHIILESGKDAGQPEWYISS